MAKRPLYPNMSEALKGAQGCLESLNVCMKGVAGVVRDYMAGKLSKGSAPSAKSVLLMEIGPAQDKLVEFICAFDDIFAHIGESSRVTKVRDHL